jgi:hypothetical protein
MEITKLLLMKNSPMIIYGHIYNKATVVNIVNGVVTVNVNDLDDNYLDNKIIVDSSKVFKLPISDYGMYKDNKVRVDNFVNFWMPIEEFMAVNSKKEEKKTAVLKDDKDSLFKTKVIDSQIPNNIKGEILGELESPITTGRLSFSSSIDLTLNRFGDPDPKTVNIVGFDKEKELLIFSDKNDFKYYKLKLDDFVTGKSKLTEKEIKKEEPKKTTPILKPKKATETIKNVVNDKFKDDDVQEKLADEIADIIKEIFGNDKNITIRRM